MGLARDNHHAAINLQLSSPKAHTHGRAAVANRPLPYTPSWRPVGHSGAHQWPREVCQATAVPTGKGGFPHEPPRSLSWWRSRQADAQRLAEHPTGPAATVSWGAPPPLPRSAAWHRWGVQETAGSLRRRFRELIPQFFRLPLGFKRESRLKSPPCRPPASRSNAHPPRAANVLGPAHAPWSLPPYRCLTTSLLLHFRLWAFPLPEGLTVSFAHLRFLLRVAFAQVAADQLAGLLVVVLSRQQAPLQL